MCCFLSCLAHCANVVLETLPDKDPASRSITLQGEKPIPEERKARIVELIEPWFCFALVWTVGATCDNDSRKRFSDWMRETVKKANVSQTEICSLVQGPPEVTPGTASRWRGKVSHLMPFFISSTD